MTTGDTRYDPSRITTFAHTLGPATRAALKAAVRAGFDPQRLRELAAEEAAEIGLLAVCRPGWSPVTALAEVDHRQALGMTRLHALQSVAGDLTTGRWDPR